MASVQQQGRIFVTTLMQTWILLSSTRSYDPTLRSYLRILLQILISAITLYFSAEFPDEHTKPVKDTLSYANVYAVAQFCSYATKYDNCIFEVKQCKNLHHFVSQ